MSNSISDGTTTVILPDDLQWSDEFAWSPVEQATEFSITGSLLVSVGTKAAGRPITLQGPDDESAWITRADLDQLRALAEAPGLELTLSFRGASRTVLFRHQDVAITATPVAPYSDITSDDYYTATLRLMEIA